MAENIPAANAVWRLKKAEDGSIFGPVSLETLKEWADSAQIAPDDHIDQSDDQWQPAPQTPFLEMVWEVTLESGQPYGPTTGGTLAEFLKEGLVTPKTEVTHATTGESKLLGAMAIDASSSAARPSAPEPAAVSSNISPEDLAPANPSSSGMIVVDIAKDQRIRQLEEDFRTLKKEHEELLQKYRTLNKELVEVRTKTGKPSSASF